MSWTTSAVTAHCPVDGCLASQPSWQEGDAVSLPQAWRRSAKSVAYLVWLRPARRAYSNQRFERAASLTVVSSWSVERADGAYYSSDGSRRQPSGNEKTPRGASFRSVSGVPGPAVFFDHLETRHLARKQGGCRGRGHLVGVAFAREQRCGPVARL